MDDQKKLQQGGQAPFEEGIDYYIENGRFVWTAHYLRKRGYCCKNGCRHCPYGFKKVSIETQRPSELDRSSF